MRDATDRWIITLLQEGVPICDRPFAAAAASIGIAETDLIERLRHLVAAGVLSRFGPIYDAERFGGHTTLAAMAVPPEQVETVATIVNAFPETAHNYLRDHHLSMWFVVSAESRDRVAAILTEIQTQTSLAVHDLPKLREFKLHLRLEA